MPNEKSRIKFICKELCVFVPLRENNCSQGRRGAKHKVHVFDVKFLVNYKHN